MNEDSDILIQRNMRCFIFPEYVAVNLSLNPEQYNVLIRITDPQNTFKPLLHPKGFKEVLELKFHDILYEDVPSLSEGRNQVFTDEDALSILSFFNKHQRCNQLIVHCEAGISRSSAVGVAWCRLNKDLKGEDYIYDCGRFRPNKQIVNMLTNLIQNKNTL